MPTDIEEEFKELLEDLPKLKEIKIPRCFLSTRDAKITEICGFADASNSAYAAVCYIISEDADGNRTSSLAFSKTRVRPLSAKNKTWEKE